MHTSNLFYNEPVVTAAKKLCEASGMQKVFFTNSGAESNEAAIKAARKYSIDKYGKERTKILTLKNSFHGRTVAALEATGQDHFHTNFFPFTGGFDYVEANNIEDLKAKADDTTCALMMELIQGESGVRPLDPEFVKEAEAFCKENDILLVIDEVQTGIGRTGYFMSYQAYGIEPDLVSCAKGLGGGIPIGALLAGEKTKDVFAPGDHGSTFGGNPLAAAMACTVIDTVNDPKFLQDVRKKGEAFKERLKDIHSPLIQEVRGLGLMLGIQIPQDLIAQKKDEMQKHGLLVLKAGKDTIRLLPPLVIRQEQLDKAAEIIEECLL
jgi:acetylornithine/N-succinyldiaminopimelate aminotransferase